MAKKRKPAPQPDPSSSSSSSEEESEDDQEEEDEEEASEDEVEEEDEDEEGEEEEEEEEEVDPSDLDAIRELLEPFGKDQLIDLLKEAALKNPALLARICASADSDPVHRKIFVHGLGWDATTETLACVFCQYGEIEQCRVVADRTTGRSKGYGFVLFRTRAAARKALKEPQKRIGLRMTSCQLASFGPPGAQPPVPDATGRKIFVSGVGDHINPERLRAFFARFGEIEDGPLGYDRTTRKLRGFAIFVYKSPDGCKKALEEQKKFFEGCELQCQRAVEGLKSKTPTVAAAGGAAAVPAVLQPNDLVLTYASQSMLGLNPMAGLVTQSLYPGLELVGQNSGVGLLNPGAAASAVAGMSPSLNKSTPTQPPYGVGLGLGGGWMGVNSISPSVFGSYGSQAALQGLGAYQNSQLPSTTAVRSQSGIGSMGTGFPSYLGH